MPTTICRCGEVLKYECGQVGKTAKCPACGATTTLPPETPPGSMSALRLRDEVPEAETYELKERSPVPDEECAAKSSARFKLQDERGPSSPPEGTPLRPPLPPEPAPVYRPKFWFALPTALAYPFRKDGFLVLLCGVGFFVLALSLPRWIVSIPHIGYVTFVPVLARILKVVILAILPGFIAGYLMDIITNSAHGDGTPPNWRDPTEYVQSVLLPLFYFAAVGLFAFGGAAAYYFVCKRSPDPNVFLALKAFGCLYLPMGILAVCVFRGPRSLNPWYVIKAIIQVPFRYAATWLIIAPAAWGIMVLQDWLKNNVHYIILRDAMLFTIAFYALFVAGRMLGLLYYTSWHRLKWLEE